MSRSGHVALVAAFVVIAVLPTWVEEARAIGGPRGFQMFEKPLRANDFTVGSLDGRVFSLSDLKGKVVLLNFWRRNCPYCVREKSYLEHMVKGLDRPDLQVLCVNLWDSPTWIHRRYGREGGRNLVYAAKPDHRRWVVENQVRGRLIGYFVVNEANEPIYEVKGFPSTYVIDKKGRVVAAHMGLADWTSPDVKEWLLRVLGPRPVARDIQWADYQLPEWLDRLLARHVTGSRSFGNDPLPRAGFTPRPGGLDSEEKPGRKTGPDRW
ncbi:MAG: TlpA disulfide reductase family protein [Desulfomonilaceae bacterium]|nr:TlpA disulfide reductase family protein [Desulfomonilaceae bacterium]